MDPSIFGTEAVFEVFPDEPAVKALRELASGRQV